MEGRLDMFLTRSLPAVLLVVSVSLSPCAAVDFYPSPRPLASRTQQAVLALLSARSPLSLAACGGRPPPAQGQTPTNPRLLPVPAWNLCDRRETVLMHEAGRRTERTPWGVGEEITVYRPTAGRESEYHLVFDDHGLLISYIGIFYEAHDLASQRDYTA